MTESALTASPPACGGHPRATARSGHSGRDVALVRPRPCRGIPSRSWVGSWGLSGVARELDEELGEGGWGPPANLFRGSPGKGPRVATPLEGAVPDAVCGNASGPARVALGADTDQVEPGGFGAGVAPVDLVHLQRHPAVLVGKLTRAREPARVPEPGALRVLEHAAVEAHLLDGDGGQARVLVPTERPESAPRPARRMSHDRMRPRVAPRVPSLIPALDTGHRRVRAARVDVEGGNRVHGFSS